MFYRSQIFENLSQSHYYARDAWTMSKWYSRNGGKKVDQIRVWKNTDKHFDARINYYHGRGTKEGKVIRGITLKVIKTWMAPKVNQKLTRPYTSGLWWNLFFYFLWFSGAPKRIRTSGLCLRRAALYPAELWVPECSIACRKHTRNQKTPLT